MCSLIKNTQEKNLVQKIYISARCQVVDVRWHILPVSVQCGRGIGPYEQTDGPPEAETPKEPRPHQLPPRHHLWRSRATRNLARHDLERPPENEERWQRAQFYYEIQPVPTQASAPTHFVFLRAAAAAANSGKAGKGVRDLRVRVLLENEVTQQAKAAPWRWPRWPWWCCWRWARGPAARGGRADLGWWWTTWPESKVSLMDMVMTLSLIE